MATPALARLLVSRAAPPALLVLTSVLPVPIDGIDAFEGKTHKPSVSSAGNTPVGNTAFGVFQDFEVVKGRYDVSLARQLGTGVGRIQIPWWAIEPRPGKFTFERSDDLITKHREAGIEVVVTVLSNSTWATKTAGGRGRLASSMPKNTAQYERMLSRLVERYKDRVRYWQIENEIFYSGFWAGSQEDYLDLLKRAHAAIKRADSRATIVLQGLPDELFVLVQAGDRSAREQLDFAMAKTAPYVDVIDFHQYLDPLIARTQLRLLRQFMARHGVAREVISTEAGGFDIRLLATYLTDPQAASAEVTELMSTKQLPEEMKRLRADGVIDGRERKILAAYLKTDPELRAIVERVQAEDVVKRVSTTVAQGASQVYWATLRDNRMGAAVGWIPVITGLVDDDGRKKPAFYTYRLLIRKLGGFERAEELRIDPTLVRFTFVGKPAVVVAWSEQPTTVDMTEALGRDRALVTSIVDRAGQTDAAAKAEEVPAKAVPIAPSPVFVESAQ